MHCNIPSLFSIFSFFFFFFFFVSYYSTDDDDPLLYPRCCTVDKSVPVPCLLLLLSSRRIGKRECRCVHMFVPGEEEEEAEAKQTIKPLSSSSRSNATTYLYCTARTQSALAVRGGGGGGRPFLNGRLDRKFHRWTNRRTDGRMANGYTARTCTQTDPSVHLNKAGTMAQWRIENCWLAGE